jgi:hypothetical protein
VDVSSVDASVSTPTKKTASATSTEDVLVPNTATFDHSPQKEGKIDQFASAFLKLSEPSLRPKRVDNGSIDEQSASSASQSRVLDEEGANKPKGATASGAIARGKSQSEDPLREFTTAMTTLSGKNKRDASKPTDTIDESSANGQPILSSENDPSNKRFQSTRPISPRGAFKEKEVEEKSVDKRALPMPMMSLSRTAPEPPLGASTKEKQETQTPTRRGSVQSQLSPEKKQEIRNMFPGYPDNRIGEDGSLDPVGAFLRRKCAEPLQGTIVAKDLAEMLEVFPYSAFCVDDKGRLPIHILGDNGVLLKDLNGRKRAGKLAQLLIRAYPESIACPDSYGRIPFVALLERWVTAQSIRKAGETEEPPSSLWPQAEWCLNMMSMVLDDMVGTGLLETPFEALSWEDRLAARHQYVLALLHCAPDLIKTILLIAGGTGKTRMRVESMSIIRRALLCPESLGKWLQDIVRKYGTSSKIAIEYFLLLSQTKPEDFVGPKRKPGRHDVEAFYDEREKVYRAIERLKVKVPKEEIERLASRKSR